MRMGVSLPRLLLLAAALSVGAGCRLETKDTPVAAQRVAPDFTLAAHDGSTVSLGDLLAKGPAIVVFYRGHW